MNHAIDSGCDEGAKVETGQRCLHRPGVGDTGCDVDCDVYDDVCYSVSIDGGYSVVCALPGTAIQGGRRPGLPM